jgi:transposase-like protein
MYIIGLGGISMGIDKTLENQVKTLNTSELEELFNLIGSLLTTNTYSSEFNREIKEIKFFKGEICPRCNKSHIIKYGKRYDRQRYKCKTCGKIFDERTSSVISSTKLPLETWFRYINLLVNKATIRKCAEELHISVKTSFFMRHRILDCLNVILGKGFVSGVVESDETYFRVSLKGNHSKGNRFVMPRKPHKRGGQKQGKSSGNKLRGISHEKVCVGICIDRKGGIISKKLCTGRVKFSHLKDFFNNKIEEGSTLCVDSHQSYMKIPTVFNVKLKRIESGKYTDGIYHIQHANSFHSRLKDWVRDFNGVSTKYLQNYLNWFRWCEITKKEKDISKMKELFLGLVTTENYSTIETIRNRYIELT